MAWVDTTATAPTTRAPAVRATGQLRRREALSGLAFLAPSLLLFGVFVYYPLLASAYISLTKWNIVAPTKPFVGLLNYERLLADPRFVIVLKNTAFYSIGVVGAAMLLGLALALVLNRQMVGRGFYRTAIFAPYVTSIAAMSLLWMWIFDPQFGLMNAFLRALLIPAPGWLTTTEWALPAIMIMAVWHNTGYNMVIFLAGLQNIPEELNEAARIDGATGRRLFWNITLPLLSPTSFFLVVTGLIASFQIFDAVAVMTQGGPLDSTNVFVFYLYQNAFQFFEMGYAAAIAMVLFAIIMTLTALQFAMSRRWVHYG
jgi:ABC-type sugar transport system permease subunit